MGYHSVRLRRGSVLGFAVLLVAAVMGTVLLTCLLYTSPSPRDRG